MHKFCPIPMAISDSSKETATNCQSFVTPRPEGPPPGPHKVCTDMALERR